MWVRSLGREDPVLLPGEFHGQRSLEGYSPWGCKELDSDEARAHTHRVSVNVPAERQRLSD